MICPDCKNNNPDGFDYCLKCGKVLNVGGVTENVNISNEVNNNVPLVTEPPAPNIPVKTPTPVTNVLNSNNSQNLSNAEKASQVGSREIKNNYQPPKEDTFQSKVQTVVAPINEEKNKGGKINWVIIIAVMMVILLIFVALGGFILLSSK